MQLKRLHCCSLTTPRAVFCLPKIVPVYGKADSNNSLKRLIWIIFCFGRHSRNYIKKPCPWTSSYFLSLSNFQWLRYFFKMLENRSCTISLWKYSTFLPTKSGLFSILSLLIIMIMKSSISQSYVIRKRTNLSMTNSMAFDTRDSQWTSDRL